MMAIWLITFLLHSTLWCGIAILAIRLRSELHARTREFICYTAIAASLLTPTVRYFMSADQALWQLQVPERFTASPEHTTSDIAIREAIVESRDIDSDIESSVITNHWGYWTIAIWGFIAVLLLLRYWIRLAIFRKHISERQIIDNKLLHMQLKDYSQRANLPAIPRLSSSKNIYSPIAIGIGFQREICLPHHALNELDKNQIAALLGHEIAHHLRRDTIRLAAINILQSVFFMQPLLRLIAQELDAVAEERCDDWAADQLNDRIAMASCLTEVASWIHKQKCSMPTVCMARQGSSLKTRVFRLLDDTSSAKPPSISICVIGAVITVVIATCIVPAVIAADSEEHAIFESTKDAITNIERDINEYDELTEPRREHTD